MASNKGDIIIADTEGSVLSGKKFDLGTAFKEWLMSFQSVSLKNKVIFYRLLATMVNAGLSIVKAIAVLEKQEKDVMMKNVYAKVINNVKTGKTLSASLAEFGSSFSESEISIIEAGEKTGKLNTSLLQLADTVERTSAMGKKLKGALIYPAGIVFTMIAVVTVIMVKVIPGLIEIFPDKSKLPNSTKNLIMISDFMQAYWWLVLLVAAGVAVMLILWHKTEGGRYRIEKSMLFLPIFGQLIRKVSLSRFARTLSSLLGSGISIVESLRIISSVVGNEAYRQRVMLLREDVKKGIKLGESLEDDKLFPDMMVQLIKIGEETASLDKVIVKMANFYDDEVDNTIAGINKLIEPIIMIVMSVVIGGIAVSVMEPLAKMSEMMGGENNPGG